MGGERQSLVDADCELETDAGVPGSVRAVQRMPSLDVLRGFALLGILVLNIEDLASPSGILHDIPLDVVAQVGPHHALDVAIMTIQWMFFEGKMRALFAALFGAGTVLLLDRIEERAGPGPAADVFHRRNMWLLLFGVIHGALIWNGDILFYYALFALLALHPLRKVAGRRLLAIGMALSLAGGTLGLANAMDLPSALPAAALQEGAQAAMVAGRVPSPAQARAVAEAARRRRDELAALPNAIMAGRGSYRQTEPDNAKGEVAFATMVFTSGWMFEILGMMIAGMGLYRTGFLTARLPSRTYLTIATAGYAVAIPTVLVGLHHSRLFGFSDAVTAVWMFLPYGIEQIAGMLANASLVLLLVRHGNIMPMQRFLAAVGRTAFSNYILTSMICQTLFRWGPWKLYGALQYWQDLYVVVGVWTFNLFGSRLWLRFFAFGPLEWIWRSLTYWQRQPFAMAAATRYVGADRPD